MKSAKESDSCRSRAANSARDNDPHGRSKSANGKRLNSATKLIGTKLAELFLNLKKQLPVEPEKGSAIGPVNVVEGDARKFFGRNEPRRSAVKAESGFMHRPDRAADVDG
jgi:hypothetical protein